jgi:hypothetical protein
LFFLAITNSFSSHDETTDNISNDNCGFILLSTNEIVASIKEYADENEFGLHKHFPFFDAVRHKC